MGNLYMDDVFMFGLVVASQLPYDFDKRSQEEKAKAPFFFFFISVTGLKDEQPRSQGLSCSHPRERREKERPWERG